MAEKKNIRHYESSHPWITFTYDLNDLDYFTWVLLGEIKSKFKHISEAPLLPEYHEKLMNVFLVKGALATTAIEGNTLTEDEVDRRIKGDLHLPPSKEYLGKEIDNVVKAYNDIGNNILDGGNTDLSVNQINNFNKIVLAELPLPDGVIPGQLRGYSVGVANYRGAPPEDCEYLMERYVNWLNTAFIPPMGQEIIIGVLKAILAHLYFVWIQPFGDGNGRTARLIEFQILLSVGVPAAAAHLMSNHYNITRSEYYRQLENASKSGGNILPFIKYAIQGFVDGLIDQIDLIQKQQIQVHWINYIHKIFTDRDSVVDKRKRTLILGLSESGEVVTLDQIRYISPKIAEMYATLSDKTISRDVDDLLSLELIVKTKAGIRCKWESMQSFLTRTRVLNR
jgi:Fic family protein